MNQTTVAVRDDSDSSLFGANVVAGRVKLSKRQSFAVIQSEQSVFCDNSFP